MLGSASFSTSAIVSTLAGSSVMRPFLGQDGQDEVATLGCDAGGDLGVYELGDGRGFVSRWWAHDVLGRVLG